VNKQDVHGRRCFLNAPVPHRTANVHPMMACSPQEIKWPLGGS
jgi:hypothetical protein